ncbi:uncharacterized protein LOC122061003 isoform X2 [Macadamia integrifolia]|uniref:uncharacterized protein LOC122061003 isoform X2 n=1 Tax=Macadamia integrifolia TaxID=60698 RepID=UPI001C52DD2A|nr:uncharacterized protein LOC122061003 isoform X2 [Macadamia integrifolia]
MESTLEAKIQEFARLTSDKLKNPKHAKPISKNTIFSPETVKSSESKQLKLKMENSERQNRVPLKEVVSDCVKRWFQDTLKEAKAGDTGMQVLVGQMYYSGYGVARDAQKGRAWISRASRSRSSVWKVSGKHPGYNASDSDSEDELKGDTDTK